MKKIHLRFYEELNDFLPQEKRRIRFEHEFWGLVSVKDKIESLNIPHTEIDLILVNGKSVGFNYLIDDGDDISVYPMFESFDVTDVQRLRAKPLRDPKFILDVHLGKLAKSMRLMGFDTFYENNLGDKQIIETSLEDHRTILTRDLGILKHSKVSHGYFVRNTHHKKQIVEIIKRFSLDRITAPFTRCVNCNSILVKVEKEIIFERLPPKVKTVYNQFYKCAKCDKIFWKGSHFEAMEIFIQNVFKAL